MQSFRVRHWSAATALFVALATPFPAAALLVGPELPVSDGTFIPFGDATDQFLQVVGNQFHPEYTPDALGRFQQVYDASVFGGLPFLIEQIRFFEDLPSVGTLNGSRFTVEIGTTTREVNELACCANTATPFADGELLLDSNRGSNMQVVAQDVLLADVFAGGVLTFDALIPFLYVPTLGENLLIEISFDPRDEQGNLVPGLGAGSEKFFVRDGPDNEADPSVFSVADNQDGFDNTGRGLRTEFIGVVVPEPASGLLLALGLVVLARRERRSRG